MPLRTRHPPRNRGGTEWHPAGRRLRRAQATDSRWDGPLSGISIATAALQSSPAGVSLRRLPLERAMISGAPIDALVVGGGPAGMAAAVELRSRGIARVVVLDREKQAGGVPRHCGHPPFGMREFKRVLTGPSYARRLTSMAEQAGVEIFSQHTVVSLEPRGSVNVSNDELCSMIKAKRVIIATGARETPRSARLISGDRPLGIQYRSPASLRLPAPASAIPTSGDSRNRAREPVGHPHMPQGRHVAGRDHREGKPFDRPLAVAPGSDTPRHPCALWGGNHRHPRQELASRLSKFAKRMGLLTSLACDGLLLTGEFVPEASLVRGSHLRLDAGSGGPEVDQYGRCSDPSYFACGNVLRPVETAGWSYREGRRIGGIVADDLTGLLAPASRSITIRRGRGIKFVVPQRLSLPIGTTGLPELQLRVTDKVAAKLRVKAGRHDLWTQRLSTSPERRVLIPLRGVEIPTGVSELTVALDDEAIR